MFYKFLQFFKTRDLRDNLNYWSSPDSQNAPETYLDGPNTKDRSLYLVNLFENFFPNKNIKILEIGSNVGRNLYYLFNNGYKNLTGVEINNNAIEIMSRHYPDCYRNSIIINGSIEDKIKDFPQNSFDVVFTMAVLEHIHPRSKWIFNDLQNVALNILTIEDERSISWKHFPRRYDKIFKRHFKQIHNEDCSYIKGFNTGFVTRVLTKVNHRKNLFSNK